MPNYCYNRVTIRGDRETLQRVKELLKGESVFDFNRVIPYPEEYAELDRAHKVFYDLLEEYHRARGEEKKRLEKQLILVKKMLPHKDGFNSGGYEWRVEHWGTKWNAVDPEIVEEREDKIVYHFSTAWSPPCPVIKRLGEMFPTVEIALTYSEEGMGYRGKFVMKGGKVALEQWEET